MLIFFQMKKKKIAFAKFDVNHNTVEKLEKFCGKALGS